MKLECNPQKVRPLSFWSWNGQMSRNELMDQINDFYAQGFGGFFIHSRAGLEIGYMSDEWFEACRISVEQAKLLGMDVYIYDEDGWPSGFAGGLVPALGEKYWFKRLCFSFGAPKEDPHRIIAAYREIPGGYLRIPLEQADDQSLYAYYATDRHYVDLIYPDTVRQFILHTHEVYKSKLGSYFGNVIKGVFTDEPQLSCHQFHWSAHLPEEFERRAGYSLLDRLWLLKYDAPGYEKLRHDYFQTLHTMMLDYFTKPLSEWCGKNDLVLTGHYACEDGLCYQVLSNGGVMAQYEYMQLPGIDHLGRRLTSPLLVRQVASVANQMGMHRILSETYGCSGWDISFEELAWIWGWQAVNGVNLPCFHLSAYTIKGLRKRDYPAFFSYQSPWFARLKLLTGWMNQINAMIHATTAVNRILVLSPITGYWCLASEGLSLSAHGIRLANQYRLLAENLLAAQLPFDIGDETLLSRHGSVEGKQFRLGKCLYDTVIVAETPSLELHTIKLLTALQENGGRLIFINAYPELTAGESGKSDLSSLLVQSPLVVQNRKAILEKYFLCQGYERDAQVLDENGRYSASDLVLSIRKSAGRTYVMLFNQLTSARSRKLLLKLPGRRSVHKQNPTQGTLQRLSGMYSSKDTYVWVQLEQYECAVYEVSDAGQEQVPCSVPPVPVHTQALKDFCVELLDDNALTLDYARYAINSGELSGDIHTIQLQELLYRQAANFSHDVNAVIEYRFESRISHTPRMYLCAETEGTACILVNGRVLSDPPVGYYMDKAILKYDITGYVQSGTNTIHLTYRIPRLTHYLNVDEMYETERNRFAYPFEIESIYITGDFDVDHQGSLVQYPDHHRIANASFFLAECNEKKPEDLTLQGLWFYRGDAAFTAAMNKPEAGMQVYIKVENPKCTLMDLYINETYALSLAVSPLTANITPYLTQERNTLKIIARGHNRNLLGPHHHIKGQCYFVGLNTFKGVRGYEDFVSPEITQESTWTDDYSFVPFRLGDVTLEYYRHVMDEMEVE